MKLTIKKYMPIVISAMLLFLFAACLSLMMNSMNSAPAEHTTYCELIDEVGTQEEEQMKMPCLRLADC